MNNDSIFQHFFHQDVTFSKNLRITFIKDGQKSIQQVRGAICRPAFPLRVRKPPQPRAGRGRGAGKLCTRLGEGQDD